MKIKHFFGVSQASLGVRRLMLTLGLVGLYGFSPEGGAEDLTTLSIEDLMIDALTTPTPLLSIRKEASAIQIVSFLLVGVLMPTNRIPQDWIFPSFSISNGCPAKPFVASSRSAILFPDNRASISITSSLLFLCTLIFQPDVMMPNPQNYPSFRVYRLAAYKTGKLFWCDPGLLFRICTFSDSHLIH